MMRKNCIDLDDCQYPDCGCVINFNDESGDETNPDDKGALIITHNKSKDVTIMVRAPRSTMESSITIPLANWLALIVRPGNKS
jgi:hypothetical protein